MIGPSRLSAFREQIAAALAENAEANEIGVLALPPDALTPPVYLLQWAEPWLEQSTACAFRVLLEIQCVSARLEPDPGIEFLELMVEQAIADVRAARVPGPITATAPASLEYGGVRYLAARLTVAQSLNVGA